LKNVVIIAFITAYSTPQLVQTSQVPVSDFGIFIPKSLTYGTGRFGGLFQLVDLAITKKTTKFRYC